MALMMEPTHNAETTVPKPTPRNSPKNTNESATATAISVISNTIFVVPYFTWETIDKARTAPSPGTMSTLGDTSITMPNPMMQQPATMHARRCHSIVGVRNDNNDMLTSIIELNSRLTTICNNCTGRNPRRSNTICNTMNSMFITNVIAPKLNGKRILNTYGTLEICDVPISPLVINAMAKEFTTTPHAKHAKRTTIWFTASPFRPNALDNVRRRLDTRTTPRHTPRHAAPGTPMATL